MKRAAVVMALLAGCSSAPEPSHDDQALMGLVHSGDIAFNLERSEEAADRYRAALARARTRDDAAAIADAGFNLATAELRAGHPRSAMQTAQEIQAELSRRDISDAGFGLITATALYRLGNLAGADRAAMPLTAGKDPAMADAAWFLRGLIADAHHDRAGLKKAASALTSKADPGDVAELRARLARDRELALHAADLRRDQMDYRGMARLLALAAHLTPEGAAAADLYLRAGRSAAAQRDTVHARVWLRKARELADDSILRRQADRALHDLKG